jgi:hypothetical protein
MDNTCELHYSPFVKCGCDVSGSHNGKHLCLRHMISAKKLEECSICFNQLTDGDVILLTCGHMFHCECMSCCRTPQCPLCRKRLEPAEAVATVGKNYIDNMAIQLYSLPVDRIKIAKECIKMIIEICMFAPNEIYNLLRSLV